ncbi:alpha/beta hydrolase [Salinisphaera sp. USBA-960]|nr:alpha/beta hydrolase [Salifodinibacter halophilus]NNC26957.1 alpha/beta hydrolase [Salifodinibacter halophilus]
MQADELHWPAAGEHARGTIDGPAGALETAIAMPKTSARGLVLVAHPHPQQGGTLDNKVTYMTARAMVESGFAAIRVNYRGVGQSEGGYDAGQGEFDDLRVARQWALQQSGLPYAGVAGFSFGAWLALCLAVSDGARALLTIGLPVEYFENNLPRADTAWRALFGDADDVIDVDRAIHAVQALQPPVDTQIMSGAGHFLHGRLSELRRLAGDHFDAHGD